MVDPYPSSIRVPCKNDSPLGYGLQRRVPTERGEFEPSALSGEQTENGGCDIPPNKTLICSLRLDFGVLMIYWNFSSKSRHFRHLTMVLEFLSSCQPIIVQGNSTVPKHSASHPMFSQTHSSRMSAMTTCSGLFRLQIISFDMVMLRSKILTRSNRSLCHPTPLSKLAFEIHLVSLINFDEFRTDRAYFIFKSNQIGLPFLGVAYGSRASHQNLLVVNNPSISYWCFNVVFDYQFFCRTIALKIKVKFLHRVLHLAKLDSPLIGYILLCLVMLSIIVVPLSMSPESSAFVSIHSVQTADHHLVTFILKKN
ncbi:hypothetical protein YC2023_061602 [Brassica napus]